MSIVIYIDFFVFIATIWFYFYNRTNILNHLFLHDEDESDDDDENHTETPTEKYINKNKTAFLAKYPGDNSNIAPIFYNRSEFLEIIKQENNPIESEWKRRLLFETTPRGNVLMYYDAFKQAFAYYSDSATIPYNILNACAMKYVKTFCCYDFFVDNSVLPEDQKSPFSKMLEEEEKAEKEKIEKKKNDLGVKGLKDAPFAKLKSYRPVGFVETDKNQSSDNAEANIPSNIKSSASATGILKKSVENRKVNPETNTGYKNTFRYLGKIANTSLLQPIEKPKLVNMTMSYASFKKSKTIQENKISEENYSSELEYEERESYEEIEKDKMD